jgi:transglutaminase-like putative cysteine protease
MDAEAAILDVEHTTVYRYSAPVEFSHHLAYLRPLDDDDQRLLDFTLQVQPQASHRREGHDGWGNAREFFSIASAHDHLHVTSRSRVSARSRFGALDAAGSPAWNDVRERLRYRAQAPYEPAAEFAAASPVVPRCGELRDYALPSFASGRSLAQAAIELMHRIHDDFRYQPASTEVHTPVLQAFAQRRGVCQDFSHVLIGALRALGLAARYVSGYLLTKAPDGSGVAMVGADASHAWVSVFCPDTPGVPAGWLDLDPTNACVPAAGHVRVACGRDYGDVSPLRGVIRGGGQHSLAVHVRTRQVTSPAAMGSGPQLA